MAYNPEHSFKAGRLFITCINAESVRGRADNANDDALSPHLLFKLPTTTNGTSLPLKQSRIGVIKGYDVNFANEVVSFDIANPDQLVIDGDISLIVQLRDSMKGLIAQCKASITEVLQSPGEAVSKALAVLNPGDTSTNSKVNLTLTFVEVRIGLLKLNLSSFKTCVEDNDKRYVSVSTPDGQSKTSSLADSANLEIGFSFWVDERNWFGELDVEIHEEGGEQVIGEGKLVMIDCLKNDGVEMTSPVFMSWDRNIHVHKPSISFGRCFLAAGIVKFKCINANGVGAVANPRVVVKAGGRTHMTKSPTNPATSSLLWDNALYIPVVSESTLVIEFGDFDKVLNEFELLGSAILDLLPLYKSANIDVSVDLTHQNELGEMLNGGTISMTLQFVFDGETTVAFPRNETVQSYIPGDSDPSTEPIENDVQGCSYSEFDIRQAFNKIDLDKNGYIGAAELRHCLICMGEHVTEAEIDMMISMLDLQGNGQISFAGFKAMATSSDPANDDFSYLYVPTRTTGNEEDDDTAKEFIKHAQRYNITKEDVLRSWNRLRRHAQSSQRGSSSTGFLIGQDELSSIMPQFGDCYEMYDLLTDVSIGDNEIDGRTLVMCFASTIDFTAEEKCELAFDMFDDGSGYLSIDQIQTLLACTHFSKRNTKKKATNLLRLAGGGSTGGVSMKALAVAAEKFPSLVFPSIKQHEV